MKRTRAILSVKVWTDDTDHKIITLQMEEETIIVTPETADRVGRQLVMAAELCWKSRIAEEAGKTFSEPETVDGD
jgi:hypothetical protein